MEWLVQAEQMKKMDQYAIRELGIPSLVLMERASLSVLDEIERAGFVTGAVLVICGSGNNGGDGFAIARLLYEKEIAVTVGFAGKESSMTEETARQKSICLKMGIQVIRLYDETNQKISFSELGDHKYTLIVDALLGIGLSRTITGAYEELIDWINLADCPVVAVDIPSGVNASSGAICGIAVKADLTVTFACKKVGQILYPGTAYCGKLVCRQIGISPENLEEKERKIWIYSEGEKPVLPGRNAYSNKGTYGKVLLIAGSKGMSGAACLAASAAYRSGCGLVRVFTAEENRSIIQTLLPEAIVTVWPETDLEESLKSALKWADAVGIGPGLGTGKTAEQIMEYVIRHCEKPLLIDADGLNLLSAHPEWKKELRENTIMTPHIGEMMRLTGKEKQEILQDLICSATVFAKETAGICVLKDARTVISDGEETTVNTSGNDGMACGGSGDVLAGLITGLLGQKMDAYEAARTGVYLHGLAGDLARENYGPRAMLAGDIIDALHRVPGMK